MCFRRCSRRFARITRRRREAHAGATPRLIRQLRAGAADLGLLTLPVDDPNLVSVPVMREELLLVTAPQHPLARRKNITPHDLVQQPFVLFEQGSGSRRAIEEFFVKEQIAPRWSPRPRTWRSSRRSSAWVWA
jgi:DNA-binding transcriptional LysR family regulator